VVPLTWTAAGSSEMERLRFCADVTGVTIGAGDRLGDSAAAGVMAAPGGVDL
jgi:hypothetical protein